MKEGRFVWDTADEFLAHCEGVKGERVSKVLRGERPDITAAQVVGIVQAVLGVAVAFGAPITEKQSITLVAAATVIAAVLFHADKGIREARNLAPRYDEVEEDEV